MAIKLKAGSGSQVLPQATYEAVLTKVEEATGDKGPFIKWRFEVSLQGEGRTLTGVSPANIDAGSRTRAWAENLSGRTIRDGEEVDLERLVGRSCKLELSVFTLDDGRKVNRVERVLRKGLVVASRPPAESTPPADNLDDGESAF